jgi:glyoxylate reductase
LAPLAARRVSLEEGLRDADVVSIHAPLTEQTRHLIDAKALALMKPTAILVNTARGPIVDEEALVAALKTGRIYGAGLDVFEREPIVHPGLIGLENAVLTPHIGSAAARYREMMTAMVEENVRAVLAGRASRRTGAVSQRPSLAGERTVGSQEPTNWLDCLGAIQPN